LAKKSDHLQLNSAQKEEIRRLTQLANRRIRAAEKIYKKAGLEILPKAVAGDYQTKEKWATAKNPISRSIKFSSQKEYRKQLHDLQRFERSRPAMSDFTDIQREKTVDAMKTVLGEGTDIPPEIMKILKKASAPELSKVWNKFSDRSAKMGFKFSSIAAMTDALTELYKEDITGVYTALQKDDSGKLTKLGG